MEIAVKLTDFVAIDIQKPIQMTKFAYFWFTGMGATESDSAE
jgi:hypothetical protein